MDIRRRKESYYYSVTGLSTADISASNTNVYLRVYNIAITFMYLTVVSEDCYLLGSNLQH